ncbi:85bf5719-38e4-48bf-a07d-174dc0cd94c2 [Sclerotinia trifoliorum]|uniref:85bf5719-38e4-48bf-a07d-174dc0cd94c2 n=1 Tax=Sclerotinia trifoliorum TaxID=28548 RepID=A0A8H2ZUH2_9HELO|nr:85bf5719-38e4-48bf-a07d-174dc0cd94c2 [Sclerotinia trifoliorum]
MCMFRLTTYDNCWAQYRHVLICPVGSHTSNEFSPLGDHVESALKCPNLKTEHIHIGHSRCSCKSHPSQEFEIVCERMWGGDFFGEVNCTLLPGSAARFELRNRQWTNCTNVDMLLRGGDRFVPENHVPGAQEWNDREWDGASKVVDWRDKDWVTLAEQGKDTRGQNMVMEEGAMSTERSQAYKDAQLAKNEIFSVDHKLTRQVNTANHYAGNISDAVAKWRQLKDQRETAANGQYMPPLQPSVGQPRYQRQASIPIIDQPRHIRHFKAQPGHEAQHNVESPSASAFGTSPVVLFGLEKMSVWEAAHLRTEERKKETSANVLTPVPVPLGPRTLSIRELARTLKEKQEKERKGLGAQSDNYLQSPKNLISAETRSAKGDGHSMDHANQAANVETRLPAAREVSLTSAHTVQSSQDKRKREREEKRNKFLQNTYNQRVAIRENNLNNQTQESAQSAQDSTQDFSMHIHAEENNASSTSAPLSARRNGMPEFVVHQDYNTTLPESDDSNLNFNNYPSIKQLAEGTEMSVSQKFSHPGREDFLTPRQLSHISRHQARLSDPKSDPRWNLSKTKLRAERRAIRKVQEISEQSKIPFEQGEITHSILQAQISPDILPQESSYLQERPERTAMRKLQEIEEQSKIQGNRNKRDILNDPDQLDAFLQDFTFSQQEIVRDIWMKEKDKVDEKYLKLYGKSVTTSGEVASSSQSGSRRFKHAYKHEDGGKDSCDSESDAEALLPGHDGSSCTWEQSRPSKLSRFLKSKRENELMVAVLSDQDKLETYLQKFTTGQQDLARESWFAVLHLADRRLKKVLSQISLVAADNGEVNDIEGDVDTLRTEGKNTQSKVRVKLARKFDQKVRALERKSKRREDQKIREGQKGQKQQTFIHGEILKEQVQAGEDSNLSNHTDHVEIANSQQETIINSLEYQATGDAAASFDKTDNESHQKTKRKDHYSRLYPDMDDKKRKSGEDKLEVESQEALNKRTRDLYYAGLIPSMGAELQIENHEDQNKHKLLRSGNIHGPPIVNDEVSGGRRSFRREKVYLTRIKALREASGSSDVTDPKSVKIPSSFHGSYGTKFPKTSEETKTEFRNRKFAAYVKSDEYPKKQSTTAGIMDSTVASIPLEASDDDDLTDVDSEVDMSMTTSKGDMHNQKQNEANSGRQRGRHVRKKPSQQERLAKREARGLEYQRESISNTGDGEEHQTGGELVAETTEARGLTKSNSNDGAEFTDYKSDGKMNMKVEGGSRSQSINNFESQPQVQSFIADMAALAQHQDTVMEGDDPGAVFDLITGNTWEAAIDLTYD